MDGWLFENQMHGKIVEDERQAHGWTECRKTESTFRATKMTIMEMEKRDETGLMERWKDG